MYTKEKIPIETRLKVVEHVISKISKRRPAQIIGASDTTIFNLIRDEYSYLANGLGITTDERFIQKININTLKKQTNMNVKSLK